MPRVLVTGAAGFVGGAVMRDLLAIPDVEVFATARGPVVLPDAADASGRLSAVGGVDLTDPGAVRRLPGDLTHVIHAAAIARFEGQSRATLHDANVNAVAHLIRHVETTSAATLQRFLFVSTFGVHDRPRFYDPALPIRETSPFAAVSEYGRSKRRGERVVRLSGLPHVVARLSWIYGPTMRRDSHIRVLAGMCRRHHPLTRIDFPGRVSVAFIDDVAKALTGLALKTALAHSIYLVAHEEPVSFGEMFRLSATALDGLGAPRPVQVPGLAVAMRLAGPVIGMKLRSLAEDYYVCDPSRLGEEGLHLSTPFSEGIRRSVVEGQWAAD